MLITAENKLILRGYSNNWTTESLFKYVKKVVIMWDHAGPGQGSKDDNE